MQTVQSSWICGEVFIILLFTDISVYCSGWIYRNDICSYTRNVGISVYTLYANCRYCTIHCAMCISILSRIITLPGLCSFFPDQLLEIYLDIKEAGLITLGSKVTTIATVIVPVYAVVCLIFQPILYRVYQKVEIK